MRGTWVRGAHQGGASPADAPVALCTRPHDRPLAQPVRLGPPWSNVQPALLLTITWLRWEATSPAVGRGAGLGTWGLDLGSGPLRTPS